MDTILNGLLVIVILLNLYVLGTSRLSTVISTAAIQGCLLGLMPLLIDEHITPRLVGLAAGMFAIKGWFIPRMLRRAMREVQIRREVEPLLGFTPSLILGAIGTGLAVIFSRGMPLAPHHADTLLVPASFSTILTGFIILTSRLKAITQVVGFLTLENGIFIFGLLLLGAMPYLVEIGVLLDLFVGIFIMTIIMNHIQRTFSSLDTFKLSNLRE